MNTFKNFAALTLSALALTAVHHNVNAAEVSAPIDIQKTVSFKGDFDKLKTDFLAKEPLLKLMPNVEHIKPEAKPDTYFYRMKPMGKMGVTHVAEYTQAYSYEVQGDQLVSTWNSVPNTGNADLQGKAVYVRGQDGEITVRLQMKGKLNKIEVPALYAMGAGAVTRGIFESNVDQYLKNISKTYAVN